MKLGTNRYNIRVRATCPRTGYRKEVERVRECTLTEARALQRQWRDELIASLTKPRAERVRMRDFARSWLDGKQGLIKLGTAKHFASIWDLHIGCEPIADLWTDEVRPDDVEQWLAHMRTKLMPVRKHGAKPKPYRASFVRETYLVLRQILRAACARAGFANPCDVVKAPKPQRPRNNFLRADEAAKVLAWVREHEPQWYAAVILSLTTGLRWSELSALKFSDVRESEELIYVVRNQYRGIVQDTTKNGESEEDPRVVPLLPEVAAALREHRQTLIRGQHKGLTGGWIFATANGTMHKSVPLCDVLARACAAVGTRHRISGHGLRHTAVDTLRRSTSSLISRSIVGHASDRMHDRYSHPDEQELIDAARTAFTPLLGGQVGGSGS
ncbi:MAG: tyrosine-type recombinase/integrase [Deltaproteobacteria bacterium]|nr:tyrosine-type recombinase/integrase [Deltaproteobacteria bacterium]